MYIYYIFLAYIIFLLNPSCLFLKFPSDLKYFPFHLLYFLTHHPLCLLASSPSSLAFMILETACLVHREEAEGGEQVGPSGEMELDHGNET